MVVTRLIFYRVVQNDPPTADDFVTDREAGKLAGQAESDIDGRSVYDQANAAISTARYLRKRRARDGDDRPLMVAQINTDPSLALTFSVIRRGKNHWQLFGNARALARASEVIWRDS